MRKHPDVRRLAPLCLLSLLALAACGPRQTAEVGLGYLEGHVAIGPLQPVERVGVPSPTPPPAVCTARRLTVTPASSGQAQTAPVQADCTYRVALSPGSYVVALARLGIDHASGLPATVEIVAEQTVRLDISVDTGIR